MILMVASLMALSSRSVRVLALATSIRSCFSMAVDVLLSASKAETDSSRSFLILSSSAA